MEGTKTLFDENLFDEKLLQFTLIFQVTLKYLFKAQT